MEDWVMESVFHSWRILSENPSKEEFRASRELTSVKGTWTLRAKQRQAWNRELGGVWSLTVSRTLVFKMSLYYNVLDSLIHLTPARSGAMVVFSGETAETLESQGRARDWVSQETMSLSSWSTYFSRASFSGSRIYFEGVELKKLRNDKVILGRTTEKKIFGRKLQESGFGVKQGIYHSLEQSKTGAGSGLPVAEAKQNWAVSQQFLNWVGGCI
ncbi:Dihydropteridine Reductase [Manis pentadactyla]|nr:Dihydropteridine Reductase [Manis pentadactyla]